MFQQALHDGTQGVELRLETEKGEKLHWRGSQKAKNEVVVWKGRVGKNTNTKARDNYLDKTEGKTSVGERVTSSENAIRIGKTK